jgi:hypothetical protein
MVADYSARLAGINVGAPAHPVPSADFGLIGLAVMGQNLILNAADHGFTVCAFNRTTSKVDRFLDNEAKGKSFVNNTILVSSDVSGTLKTSYRQAHRRCPLHPGVLRQAQAPPSHYAPRHGRQARR